MLPAYRNDLSNMSIILNKTYPCCSIVMGSWNVLISSNKAYYLRQHSSHLDTLSFKSNQLMSIEWLNPRHFILLNGLTISQIFWVKDFNYTGDFSDLLSEILIIPVLMILLLWFYGSQNRRKTESAFLLQFLSEILIIPAISQIFWMKY